MELTFGEQIKIILKRKNMTIRQLAELVEVQTGKPMSRQNLTQKLNRDNFQEQDMKEIAQALGCAVQISVIDPAEATASSAQIVAASQPAEPTLERRPAKDRTAEEAKLAKKEAAVTRQPIPEEKERRFKEPEEDKLAWARKKPLIWPTLTVPAMAVKEPEDLPFAEDLFSEPEELEDLGESAFWEEVSVTDVEPEKTEETKQPEKPERAEEPKQSEKPERAEEPKQPEKPERAEEPKQPEKPERAEEPKQSEEPGRAEEAEKSEKPEEPEHSEEADDSESADHTEVSEGQRDSESSGEADDLDDLEDLEFFDLEDFYGEEVSQAYVMQREEPLPEAQQTAPGEVETPLEQGNAWENQGLDMIPEGGGDVSFASAPYVIPRKAEEDAEKTTEEMPEESGEASLSGLREPGSFSGSKGDISSVSAPYVIPREPEETPPGKPMGENGYWHEVEEPEADVREELFEEESAEPEEEDLTPDMEKKIASWDAAVKRRLENPFLRALEGRARRGGKGREAERKNDVAGTARRESKLRILPEARTETVDRKTGVTGAEAENEAEAKVQGSRAGRPEAEPLDLQGPAIDPVTGKEYETNTVKHHPTQPDMLLVYDQDEHRWIVQAERAFLNFQINKRALLGKDYEPPVYLD